jgi:hypothetical protein
LRRFNQSPKEVLVRFIILHPFRMPLDAEDKPAGLRPGGIDCRLYRFNHAILCPGGRTQMKAYPVGVNGLVMVGICHERVVP